METTQDLVSRLTAQQKQQFDDAIAAYNAKRYSEALATWKLLLNQLPGDAVLSAIAMLTRACAESGDTACRDAGIVHMLELHGGGVTPQGMQQNVVEHIKVGGNTLVIFTSLVPWGYYQVYNVGRLLDGGGKLPSASHWKAVTATKACSPKNTPKKPQMDSEASPSMRIVRPD